jgi:hypothetical protein
MRTASQLSKAKVMHKAGCLNQGTKAPKQLLTQFQTIATEQTLHEHHAWAMSQT